MENLSQNASFLLRQIHLSILQDGTVRAFDLVRYRNFRTCTSPRPVQFNCVAVDPSGEVCSCIIRTPAH